MSNTYYNINKILIIYYIYRLLNYKCPSDQLDYEFIMKLKSKDYKCSSSDVTKLLRIIYTDVSFSTLLVIYFKDNKIYIK